MPARMRDIVRVARGMGILAEQPGKGSHWKFRDADGTLYVIAAHNSLKQEIDDIYVSGLCRRFGLDLKEFKRML